MIDLPSIMTPEQFYKEKENRTGYRVSKLVDVILLEISTSLKAGVETKIRISLPDGSTTPQEVGIAMKIVSDKLRKSFWKTTYEFYAFSNVTSTSTTMTYPLVPNLTINLTDARIEEK